MQLVPRQIGASDRGPGANPKLQGGHFGPQSKGTSGENRRLQSAGDTAAITGTEFCCPEPAPAMNQ